jgi:hypothetical protein
MAQGLGWNNEVTAHAVALFPHDMIHDFIGMEVSNVIIFTQDLPINTSAVEVWEGYDINYGGPVDLVGSEDFSPVENGQASVDLTNPVFVNGKDLWVGWTFTDPGAGFYCIAMDAGPPTPGVNYIKTGIAWGVIDNPDYGNFGIVATLTGTAINTWLELDVTEGAISGGSSEDITVSFDLTDLAHGTYESTLVIDNNDADESWYEIPVTLTVGVGVNDIKDGIMTFPNPVSNMFSIVSDSKIHTVSISDLTGKMIRSMNPKVSDFSFDISSLAKGVYLVKIETDVQTITRKVVVE